MLLRFNDTIINTKHLRRARYDENEVSQNELRLAGYELLLKQNPNLRGRRTRLEIDFVSAGNELKSVFAGESARTLWRSLCALSRSVSELADEAAAADQLRSNQREIKDGSGEEIIWLA